MRRLQYYMFRGRMCAVLLCLAIQTYLQLHSSVHVSVLGALIIPYAIP